MSGPADEASANSAQAGATLAEEGTRADDLTAGTSRDQWRQATVSYNEPAASDMVALGLQPNRWIPHRAGQHYEIRFPGDELSRKFSVVTSPEQRSVLEFGIQILPSGLLSPRLAACRPVDRLEIRGPVGEAFVWTPAHSGPVVLLGAGAGITPLLSIYEHCLSHRGQDGTPLFLLSATRADRVYRYERYRSALITRFTETEPRIDAAFLAEHLAHILQAPLLPDPEASAWICGPPGFIDSVVDDLLDLGFPESRIRSESFS